MKKFTVLMTMLMLVALITPCVSVPAVKAEGGSFGHSPDPFLFKPVAQFNPDPSIAEYRIDNKLWPTIKNTTGTPVSMAATVTPLGPGIDYLAPTICFKDALYTAKQEATSPGVMSDGEEAQLSVELTPNPNKTSPGFGMMHTAVVTGYPYGQSSDSGDKLYVGSVYVPATKAVMKINDKTMKLSVCKTWNEKTKTYQFTTTTEDLTSAPVINSGSTYLPLRNYAEMILGAKVSWDANTKTATFLYGNPKSVYWKGSCVIDKYEITIEMKAADGKILSYTKDMDRPAKLIGGATMLPVKAMGEIIDSNVEWNASTKTVTIYFPSKSTRISSTTATYSHNDVVVKTPSKAETFASASAAISKIASSSAGSFTSNGTTYIPMRTQSTVPWGLGYLSRVKWYVALKAGDGFIFVSIMAVYDYMMDAHFPEIQLIASPNDPQVDAWDRVYKSLKNFQIGGTGPNFLPASDQNSTMWSVLTGQRVGDPNPTWIQLLQDYSKPWYNKVIDQKNYYVYGMYDQLYYIVLQAWDPATKELVKITPYSQKELYSGQTGPFDAALAGGYVVQMPNVKAFMNNMYRVYTPYDVYNDAAPYFGKEYAMGQKIFIKGKIDNLKPTDKLKVGLLYHPDSFAVNAFPNTPYIGHLTEEVTVAQFEQGFYWTPNVFHLAYFKDYLIREIWLKTWLQSGGKTDFILPYGPYGFSVVLAEANDKTHYVESPIFAIIDGAERGQEIAH